MVNCRSCAAQLADDANFCQRCGQPRRSIAATDQGEAWEVCELLVRMKSGFFGPSYTLEAVATGESGRRSIASGIRLEDPYGIGFGLRTGDVIARNDDVLSSLVKKLTGEGWQPVLPGVPGPAIFSASALPTFRRRER